MNHFNSISIYLFARHLIALTVLLLLLKLGHLSIEVLPPGHEVLRRDWRISGIFGPFEDLFVWFGSGLFLHFVLALYQILLDPILLEYWELPSQPRQHHKRGADYQGTRAADRPSSPWRLRCLG
jgi:hypothetical protein